MNNVIQLFPETGTMREQPVAKVVTKEQVIEHLAGLLLWQKANQSDGVCASSDYSSMRQHGRAGRGCPPDTDHKHQQKPNPFQPPVQSPSHPGYSGDFRRGNTPAWQGNNFNGSKC